MDVNKTVSVDDNEDNRRILAKNLQRLVYESRKSRTQVCTELGFNYNTFNDWYNGRKYPRMPKLDKLANYFNVDVATLTEEETFVPTTSEGEQAKRIMSFLTRHRGHQVLFNYMMEVEDVDVPILIEMTRKLIEEHKQTD